MIIKDKVIISSSSPKIKAGQKQELDVAFYLRRAFKDHDQVFVFNDIKLTHNNETAQIDHLIVHTFGFILIESKSITGEVTVNKYEEWSRSYNGKWNGMPSPIKQVELQKDLLKKLLKDYDSELLNKLLGIERLQKGFGGRQWEHLCAISSNSIINRDDAPSLIAKKLIKSEFIVDTVTKLMDLSSSKPNSFTFFKAANRPWFNDDEIIKICDFLLQKSTSEKATKEKLLEKIESPQIKLDTHVIKSTDSKEHAVLQLKCKECNTQNTLEPSWGKFGYYVKCINCSINTPMKAPCLSCSSKKTKVNKKKEIYTLTCQDCETNSQLIYKKELLCEK
ncbi:nuclease-related domain-containing protein [Colwellia sp. MB02u-9]|uniref:nuclease-related domain-containing protein n=1 Tax=Colwellia sp. MB02u-9 TaxID=2759823 RepID=UPI0015F5B9B9|nr:nuclease-related domain-containing protein [Colwellia sp. MB02u-9]MBA6294415.1 NERD domain-containing protein [Colwellia sp. MB02u-9]